jgi:hypothetical protein
MCLQLWKEANLLSLRSKKLHISSQVTSKQYFERYVIPSKSTVYTAAPHSMGEKNGERNKLCDTVSHVLTPCQCSLLLQVKTGQAQAGYAARLFPRSKGADLVA